VTETRGLYVVHGADGQEPDGDELLSALQESVLRRLADEVRLQRRDNATLAHDMHELETKLTTLINVCYSLQSRLNAFEAHYKPTRGARAAAGTPLPGSGAEG